MEDLLFAFWAPALSIFIALQVILDVIPYMLFPGNTNSDFWNELIIYCIKENLYYVCLEYAKGSSRVDHNTKIK